MKKLFLLFIALSVFFLVVSCSDGLSDNKDMITKLLTSYTSSSSSSKLKLLKFYAYSSGVSFSRSILPEPYNTDNLDFYVYGLNKATDTYVQFVDGNTTKRCIEVSIKKNDETSGMFELKVEDGKYIFYLAAVPAGESFNYANPSASAVFIGNSTVDTRAQDSFKIYLNPLAGKNLKGSVILGVYTSKWSLSDYENMSSTVGIYEQNSSNSVVVKKTYNIPRFDNPPSISDFDSYTKLECSDIPSGSYNFIVSFTDGKNEYIYRDEITIYANRFYTAFIPVNDVISSEIEAPSDFIVGYKDSSLFSNQRFYLVAEWTDNSLNEECFKIELLDISSPANTTYYYDYVNCILGLPTEQTGLTKDISWNGLINDSGCPTPVEIDNDYLSSSGYSYDGTLLKNSNYVVFSLPMGVKYLVRLFAQNSNFKSAYVYPNIYSGDFASGISDVHSWNSDALAINRYAIYYNMKNGQFFDDTDASNGTYTDVSSAVTSLSSFKNVVYSSYSKNGCKFFLPENINYDSGKKASLKQIYSGVCYPWLGWKQDSLEGEFVYQTGEGEKYYKDFKSITLFAYFRDNDQTVHDSNKVKFYTSTNRSIDNSTIMVYHGNNSSLAIADSNIFELDNNSITISRSAINSSYLYCLCRTSLENFIKTNLTFGRQGYTFTNYGEGSDFSTVWSGGSSYSYDYWIVPIDNLANDLYYMNFEAYESLNVEPYRFSIKVTLTD